MFERILVPSDSSEHADVVLDYAMDLAEHFEATVHPYHVIDSRFLENVPRYDSVMRTAKT